MKGKYSRISRLIVLAIAWLFLFAGQPAFADDESFSTATSVNRGEIVGETETVSGDVHAFLFKDGVMHDLGTLP